MRDWQFKTLHLNRGFRTRILLLIISLKNVIPPQRKWNGFPQVAKKNSHQAASNSLSCRSSEWILTLRIFAQEKKKDESTSPIWTLSNVDKSPFKCRVVLGIKRRKVSFRVHVRLWKCQPPQFLPAPLLSTATRVSGRCRVRHAAREMRLIGAPISVARHLVCSLSLRLRF